MSEPAGEIEVAEGFTCTACGAHDLVVVHEYQLTLSRRTTTPCVCGQANSGVAAELVSRARTDYRQWGLLRGHSWEYEADEETPVAEQEADSCQVSCPRCVHQVPSVETTEDSFEIDEASRQFFVRCDGCDREVEFGWSEPEGGGLIWPVECADFNPLACWPEPRYRERWAERGWMGTETATA